MKLVKRISYLVLLCCLFSCSESPKVDKTKLAHAYVDLLVAEDYYAKSDSLELKRAEILKKYSLSEELYDSAFKSFTHDIDEWNNFFELANTYLDSLKVEVTSQKGQEQPSQP